MSLAPKFQAIAARAISDAEAVKCSFPKFIEGLELMRDLIAERLLEATGEQADREGDDE